MPFETVVPAPSVEWETDWAFPNLPIGTILPAAVDTRFYRLTPPVAGNITNGFSVGGSGGTGVTKEIQVRQGRLCFAYGSTSAYASEGWAFPWWVFDGAGNANENSGYKEWQGARTAWFQIGINLSAVDATLGVGSGFYFVPYGVGTPTAVPGRAGWNGGVGISGDGAGGLAYRSYGVGANNLLETVAIPAAALGTVTNWSTVDFFFRAATPAAAGYLTVQFNGISIVNQRSYASGLLTAPAAISANNWTYALNMGVNDTGTGTRFSTWVHARWGRFLLDGTEVLQ